MWTQLLIIRVLGSLNLIGGKDDSDKILRIKRRQSYLIKKFRSIYS